MQAHLRIRMAADIHLRQASIAIRHLCQLSGFMACAILRILAHLKCKTIFRTDFQLTVRGGAMASLFFATVGFCPSYNFQKNLFTFDYFAGFQGGFRFSQYLGSRFEAFFRAPIALNDKYSFSLKLALVLHEPWQKKLPSFSGK